MLHYAQFLGGSHIYRDKQVVESSKDFDLSGGKILERVYSGFSAGGGPLYILCIGWRVKIVELRETMFYVEPENFFR